jgi:SAM-dependent methyltransferase
LKSTLTSITRSHFDAYAAQWSDRLRLHCYLARYETVAELIPDSVRTVIDLGCGTGNYSQLFRDKVKYVGLDNSTKMIEIARSQFPQREFQVSGVEKTDFQDGSFDASLAVGVFEYLDNPDVLSRELRRITRSGGRIICTFPNKDEKLKIRGSLFFRVLYRIKRAIKHDRPVQSRGVPSGYTKAPEIIHRAFDRAMVLKLFPTADPLHTTIRYANFRILYYWCGLSSMKKLDELISNFISKKQLDKYFRQYASVLIVGLDNSFRANL